MSFCGLFPLTNPIFACFPDFFPLAWDPTAPSLSMASPLTSWAWATPPFIANPSRRLFQFGRGWPWISFDIPDVPQVFPEGTSSCKFDFRIGAVHFFFPRASSYWRSLSFPFSEWLVIRIPPSIRPNRLYSTQVFFVTSPSI